MASYISTYNDFQPLNEGLSALLYHFTYLGRVAALLKDNRFATSGAIATNADMWKNNGKFFYLSTQRSKNSKLGYGGRNDKYGGRNACLVLDGQKLRQKYQGRPADYWGHERPAAGTRSHHDFKALMMATELEDRIVTDQPYIENAASYIKEIHLVFDEEGYNEQAELTSILAACHEHDIELYVYTDVKDYVVQRKDKAVRNVGELQFTGAVPEPYKPRSSDDDNLMRDIGTFVYLLMQDRDSRSTISDYFGGKLPEKYEDAYWEYCDNELYQLGEYDLERYYDRLENEIHNLRQQPSHLYRVIMSCTSKQIRKMNAKSLKEFIYRKALKTWVVKRPAKTPTHHPNPPRDWKLPVKLVLMVDDGEREYEWSKSFWTYTDTDTFWGALPAEYRMPKGDVVKGGKKGEDSRAVKDRKERYYFYELIDDTNATFKQVYNTLVKRANRRVADEVFKACGCVVKRVPYTPDDFWVKEIR